MTGVPLPLSAKLLALGFTASGVMHLVRPETFMSLMPSWVPAHHEVILASGAAELACAAGLAFPRTRTVAGYASAALLVGVFPGNVQMAKDAVSRRDTTRKVVTFARLPLQLPMIRIALKVARSS